MEKHEKLVHTSLLTAPHTLWVRVCSVASRKRAESVRTAAHSAALPTSRPCAALCQARCLRPAAPLLWWWSLICCAPATSYCSIIISLLAIRQCAQHDLQHGSLITFPKEENLGNKRKPMHRVYLPSVVYVWYTGTHDYGGPQ